MAAWTWGHEVYEMSTFFFTCTWIILLKSIDMTFSQLRKEYNE